MLLRAALASAITRVADRDHDSKRLQLSHDEKTLYVNDTSGINIYAFDVQPDGRLANRRVLRHLCGTRRVARPRRRRQCRGPMGWSPMTMAGFMR